MKPPPLHVLAKDYRTAQNFVVHDLKDDHRRLNYIDRPEQLHGRRDWVIIVHPSAPENRRYTDLIMLARHMGCVIMLVNDEYSRHRYNYEQELDRLARYPSPAELVVPPFTKIIP